jgi:iron complex outermembrane receptor protein
MTRLVALAVLCLVPSFVRAQSSPAAPPQNFEHQSSSSDRPADSGGAPPVTASEQVTVTGHAEEVPFQTLARSVVVITRDEIERLPAHAIADVLGYAASVDVRSRGPYGVQSDFSIRGATFGQALVLVDGMRLNDTQSGHHNGDIPVPLEAIDRIEVLLGPGSSLYGADAFGGTINVITRRGSRAPRATVTAGSFGLIGGDATVGGRVGSADESIAVSANRSSGFTTDRDFRTLDVSSSTAFAGGARLFVSHLRKGFGAAGYYGPALSTERTDQTLVTLAGPHASLGQWDLEWQAAYRTHGDEFLYDSTRPGVPNRHRTHATEATGRFQRALGATTRVTVGGEAGGDWIRSNNLGDHQVSRGSLFAEIQERVGSAVLYPGLRFDGYSTFGHAWSPSLSGAVWLGGRAKLRGSIGRAFRVPTFTERFYEDPSNLGNPALAPERAWSGEAGVDWLAAGGWTAAATVFDRREHDTIDFVRASTLERWRAENVRDVETRGLELSLQRALAGTLVSAQYTYLDATTDSLPLLSKYVLQYARHAVDLSASLPLPDAFEIGPRLGYRERRDGQTYWLLDARVGRRFGHATAFVEGSNLLDQQYEEIPGVAMPGAWLRAGVTVAGR